MAATEGTLKRKRVLLGMNEREALTGYLFIAPALISLAVWWIWPIIYSTYREFQRA